MERLAYVDTARVGALREQLSTNLPENEQAEDPLDRRDRSVVAYYRKPDGAWAAANIERDDDVRYNDTDFRVIGPARGRSSVYGYRKLDKFGEVVLPIEVTRIIARAPANTNGPAMPVVPGYYEPAPAENIEALRQDAFKRVDARSAQLIEQGFTFDNIVFSASLEAQARYNGMMAFIDALPYPLGINSLDDTEHLELEKPDDVRAFCLKALGHIKGVVDSGSVEKQKVRDMTEPAQLREYQDPR